MNHIKHILVPFDFTESAINALDYALTFVGFENDIKITAVYASTSPITSLEEVSSEAKFVSLVASLNKKTKNVPKLKMVTGEITNVILSEQNFLEADLILMGTMGDSSADTHLTNTSKLVLEADCPVLSIPLETTVDTPKHIALVLGNEEIEHKSVLNFLLDIARSFNAKVHVLTIYKESIYKEKVVVESNEDSLEYYLEHFYASHDFEKNQDIEQGIMDYVADKEIDLLAIIPRNHAEKTKPSEGRLTKLLTLHATVPVLTLD
ncbi:universal stress protein [Flavobacterium sp. ASW18X]|uniref:universal stress protein n=1 Tax=Flavobacterium sp. ASW18X TaxID=2572595 RepID=UPI0010AE40B2|nr:universal stress protein [Flavobacterium sp. ASW18X]TKD63519.1 universal stress protein [Flavobacterium sp. ASW18X]